MSDKFNELIELIISEETDQAKALFHDIVVDKSRSIYESLIDETEEDEELDSSEEGTAKTLDAAHEGTEVSAEIPAENTRPAMFQQEKVSVTGAKMEAYRPPQLGEYSRHRIRLTKLGSVALLGHLDLMRELGRIVRRAGLRLKY